MAKQRAVTAMGFSRAIRAMADTPYKCNGGDMDRAVLAMIGVTIALAGAALIITAKWGDVISPLLIDPRARQAIAVLIGWFFVAWAARRLSVGKVADVEFESRSFIILGAIRVSLLFACGVLAVSWLVTLALGHIYQFALLRAAVLMFVLTAFTGIFGGAIANSLLALRHWLDR